MPGKSLPSRASYPGAALAAGITIRPIAEGRLDEWRAFHDDLMGSRRVEWIASKKRRGITRQVVSLAVHDGRHLAVVVTEADDPDAAFEALKESSDPFDAWLMEHVRDLHGEPLAVEVVLDTAPRAGRWRGWRR